MPTTLKIGSQLEQYLMKYGWAGSGMVMIAIPILTSKAESDRAGESGVGRHKVLNS